MRVIVTGASGNVGTSVLEALGREAKVDEIVGLARRVPTVEMPKVRWVGADVVADDLGPIFSGADAVIHLAWAIQPSRDEAVTERINVEGSRRVFDAAAAAKVPALVYASSVGAYSPGPKDRLVDESWRTAGIATSFYSRDKAEVERSLDAFERARPETRVVRLRPGLIFKREAASGS
ncbi:MAG: NAD-dependent epimerase/dehydratase family protein, partial [Solirubrobacterales bacterium]